MVASVPEIRNVRPQLHFIRAASFGVALGRTLKCANNGDIIIVEPEKIDVTRDALKMRPEHDRRTFHVVEKPEKLSQVSTVACARILAGNANAVTQMETDHLVSEFLMIAQGVADTVRLKAMDLAWSRRGNFGIPIEGWPAPNLLAPI